MRVFIAGEERSVRNPSEDWLQKNVSMLSDGFGFYISDRDGVRTVTDRRVVLVAGRRMTIEQARWLNASRHTKASGKVQLPVSNPLDNIYTPNNRQGWWGGLDTRPRCKATDKVAFQTEAHAELQASKIREREAFKKQRTDGKVMQAYQCKRCKQWHVGHGKLRAN